MKVITPLWDHQQQALDFVMSRPASALFMGMGSGKTLVALKWMEQHNFNRVLIFCPYRVVQVWYDEIEKHTFFDEDKFEIDEQHITLVPSLWHKGIGEQKLSIKERAEMLDEYICHGHPLIAVINYETVGRKDSDMVKFLKTDYHKFDAIILDEAHHIKSAGSRTSWFFKWLGNHIEQKLCLTGTPMPNSKLDIYGMYRCLDSSIFGTNFKRFQAQYAIMGGYNMYQVIGWHNEKEFNEKVDSVAFRVDSDAVLDLPDEINLNYYAQLSTRWRAYYNKLERDFFIVTDEGELTTSITLTKILRLQQIAGGNIQYDADESVIMADPAKINVAIETIEDIGDESIVVFLKYLPEIDALRNRLNAVNPEYPPYELSGRVGVDELDLWRKHGGVLLVQIDAGAEGIDLTKARYVIFYSIGYSLGKYEQAKRRVRRPGARLDTPVTYIHLIVENTVDGIIYKSLQDKRETIGAVLEAMRNKYDNNS